MLLVSLNFDTCYWFTKLLSELHIPYILSFYTSQVLEYKGIKIYLKIGKNRESGMESVLWFSHLLCISASVHMCIIELILLEEEWPIQVMSGKWEQDLRDRRCIFLYISILLTISNFFSFCTCVKKE